MARKNWTGSSSRRKGHNFERETAEQFRRFFPEAKRGLAQTRNAGETPDVDGTPYWVECKRGNLNLCAAIKQARTQTDGRTPLVVGKFDRERTFVAMDIEDFWKLFEKLHPVVALPESLESAVPNGDSDHEDSGPDSGIKK